MQATRFGRSFRGSYWLITLAAVYALVHDDRNAFVNTLLVIMILAGTLSCVLADRQETLDRRRKKEPQR